MFRFGSVIFRVVSTSILESMHSIRTSVSGCYRRFSHHSSPPVHSLSPLSIFNADTGITESALILLNQPLPPLLTRYLFHKCTHRVCSDGGANQLFQLPGCSDLTPDQIVGDLDSTSPSVLQHYRQRGTQVIRDTGQDSTDLSKALFRIPSTLTSVYILPAFTGRFDHVLACIDSLYQWNNVRPSIPVFLLSESTLCFLIPAGLSSLEFPAGQEDQFCGLVPVGEPASCVTTTGLHWNVTNESMRLGGLISTSNKLNGRVVTVSTDKPLLFTSTYSYNANL